MREGDWEEHLDDITKAHILIWSEPAGSGKIIEPYSYAEDLQI